VTTFKNVANNAQSTLVAQMGLTDSTLTLVGYGSLFPDSNFWATIENSDGTNREIVLVTTRSGNSFSGVLRGQQTTSVAVHSAGSQVRLLWTKGHVDAITDAILSLENKVVVSDEEPSDPEEGTIWLDTSS
jgi:hypothetical protein